jgi:hypothetical protein
MTQPTLAHVRFFHHVIVPCLAGISLFVPLFRTNSPPLTYVWCVTMPLLWIVIGVLHTQSYREFDREQQAARIYATALSLAFLPLLFWIWQAVLLQFLAAEWATSLACILSNAAAAQLYQMLLPRPKHSNIPEADHVP